MITLKYTGTDETTVEQLIGGERVTVKKKDVVQFADKCGKNLLKLYPHLFVEAGASDKITIEMPDPEVVEQPSPPAPVEIVDDVDVIDTDKLPKV